VIFLRILAALIGFGVGSAQAAEVGQVSAFALSSCPENWSSYGGAVGRVVVGVGTLGSDTYSLSATGGSARHTLTLSEIPAHNHAYNQPGWPYENLIGQNGTSYSLGLSAPGSSLNLGFVAPVNAGGGQAHENRQPYLALLYCVRTAEDEIAMGFWPEMTMEGAMDIAGAVLVLFALAWGLSVVVRFTINQR
jgi:hypothetical protein